MSLEGGGPAQFDSLQRVRKSKATRGTVVGLRRAFNGFCLSNFYVGILDFSGSWRIKSQPTGQVARKYKMRVHRCKSLKNSAESPSLPLNGLSLPYMKKLRSRIHARYRALAVRYYIRRLTRGSTPYPAANLAVSPADRTISFVKTINVRSIAEIGTYKGGTSLELAKYLNNDGELHLFDFEDLLRPVIKHLTSLGYRNIHAHPNSRKMMDSYNWSLMKILQAHDHPIFDYIFLDGAHVWAVDALTFLLCDRLLKVGGYIDFDDYDWTIQNSPSMNPVSFPPTQSMFTEEQIKTRQVALIVDLLVRRRPNYKEVFTNKIYQKTSE